MRELAVVHFTSRMELLRQTPMPASQESRRVRGNSSQEDRAIGGRTGCRSNSDPGHTKISRSLHCGTTVKGFDPQGTGK